MTKAVRRFRPIKPIGARRYLAVWCLAALPLGPARGETAPPIPGELLRVIPKDVVAFYAYGGPAHDTGAGNGLAMLNWGSLAIDRAQEMGVLSSVDSCARMWLDSLSGLGTAFRYPHAVALLDVAADARADGGHQLSRLSAALILDVGDDPAPVVQRIQHLLSAHTNTDESTLTTEPGASGERFMLRDARLPDWAVLSWGRIGRTYVIAIGQGAFERVEQAVRDHNFSILAQPWFTSAYLRANGSRAVFSCYLGIEDLRKRADAGLTGKIEDVQRALGLAGADRAVLNSWRSGKSLEVRAIVQRGKRDELIEVAGAHVLARHGGPKIDEGASRYVAFDASAGDVLVKCREAFLASGSPKSQASSNEYWADIERQCGVSFRKDIFAALGNPFVIHDYPQHPLRLPLMRTVLVRLNGDAGRLQLNIDRLLTTIDEAFLKGQWYRLSRSDAGIWSLNLGLLSPSLTVTDEWLVFSYSHGAVQMNLDSLGIKSTHEHEDAAPAAEPEGAGQ